MIAGDTPKAQMPQPMIHIGSVKTNAEEELRVTIDRLSGRPLVDVRVFAKFTMARVLMPTKRAISVPIGQLSRLIKALQKAKLEAVRLGLADERD